MELVTAMAENAMPLTSVERPIDLVHLARMTFGERGLEREVLALFDRQAAILMDRMETANAGCVATLAHTLKGSARGIGAWQVARAAEAVETGCDSETSMRDLLPRLRAATDEARALIAELLRAH